MTIIRIPTNAKQLAALVKEGEGPTLEFKHSTGEMKEGMQTICGFLNSKGGTVLFGVDRKGNMAGQDVSEKTIHEAAASFNKLEPPASVKVERVKMRSGREVLALSVEANHEAIPFSYNGRAFERVGNTTRKMSQNRYESLLLDRAHCRRIPSHRRRGNLGPGH